MPLLLIIIFNVLSLHARMVSSPGNQVARRYMTRTTVMIHARAENRRIFRVQPRRRRLTLLTPFILSQMLRRVTVGAVARNCPAPPDSRSARTSASPIPWLTAMLDAKPRPRRIQVVSVNRVAIFRSIRRRLCGNSMSGARWATM